jgi:hypothetical protein
MPKPQIFGSAHMRRRSKSRRSAAPAIRDDIYADTKLIAHLEANPDIDEAFKGPIILAARADVHCLRKILGPGERISAAPCCYFRKRLYVR